MSRLTKRGFVKMSARLPQHRRSHALAGGSRAVDTGNLRVEKDIIFGKDAGKGLRLIPTDRLRACPRSARPGVHLFGGGFFVGNKDGVARLRGAQSVA